MKLRLAIPARFERATYRLGIGIKGCPALLTIDKRK